MDRTTEHGGGRGIDEQRENRPGVPMAAERPVETGAHWDSPSRQQQRRPHPYSAHRDELTPVYGSGPGPRLASGALRRLAYQIPEHHARRWMLLLFADRMDVLEHRIPELMTGRSWGQLAEQVRANPVGMLGLAFGVGFMLERTRLLQVVGSALAGAVLPGSDGGPDARDRGADGRSDAEEQLLAWLNDAYAVERAQVPILENHAKDAKRLPEVRKRDLEHLEETKQHARDIERCIRYLGEKPSASKKLIGRVTGAMNSIATEPFDDEVVKNFLMDYATEHFEIACYRSLIVAANEAGHPKIAGVCSEILREEEKMAAWLEKKLPMAVQETLN
jgi:ferritin-like metal-binding protein YciE